MSSKSYLEKKLLEKPGVAKKVFKTFKILVLFCSIIYKENTSQALKISKLQREFKKIYYKPDNMYLV